jgi:hypothetical protein
MDGMRDAEKQFLGSVSSTILFILSILSSLPALLAQKASTKV